MRIDLKHVVCLLKCEKDVPRFNVERSIILRNRGKSRPQNSKVSNPYDDSLSPDSLTSASMVSVDAKSAFSSYRLLVLTLVPPGLYTH